MNGSYLFVTPIENLVFDDDFKKKEINIGDVLFVKRKRLPYIRKHCCPNQIQEKFKNNCGFIGLEDF